MVTQRYDLDFPMVVDGHKLKIGWVRAYPADCIHKDDRLAVWLELDEAVGGTIGFSVYLPVRKYSKNEFIFLVQNEAKLAFGRFMRDEKERREKAERERMSDKDWDTYACEIHAMFQ